MASALITIGYGSRDLPEVVDLLETNQVEYVVDVRSAPYSRYKPEFSREPLSRALAEQHLTYAFMGNELGGRPDDPTCYDSEGHVDYDRCRERPAFQEAIERLLDGWRNGHRIALLCSERKPEECHRAKLVAEALVEHGAEVEHIDADGEVISHADVLARLESPQLTLLGGSSAASRSRRAYR